jgi:hypothetical protein
MTQTEDFSEPILSGSSASDYERYLRTDELLALQPDPEAAAHRESCCSPLSTRLRSCG